MKVVELPEVDRNSIIEVCERALERAKAGDFESVLFIGFTADWEICTLYSGTGSLVHQLGALEFAKAKTIDRMKG